MTKGKKVPSVPESLVKKRKRYAAVKAARAKVLRVEKKVRASGTCGLNEALKAHSLTHSLCFSSSESQNHPEPDLLQSSVLPQRVPADVQTGGPHGPHGSQGRKLLRPRRAQTGLRHQDQRVRVCLYREVTSALG